MVDLSDDQIVRAQLGIEVETFVRSNIGRYLLDRATEEEDDLVALLIKCKPTDIEMNTEIRNKLRVTELFRAWLNDAIQSGLAATQDARMQEALDED